MSLAVGLDVSEMRMGWAIVHYDTHEPLALGVEDLRLRDGGWAENQMLRAMHDVAKRVDSFAQDVYVVGIEDAYLGPNRMASLRHAGVVGMATMAARVVFGDVTIWPIPAGSWRKAIGLKPASRKRADVKAATMEWALATVNHLPEFPVAEDSADALGIAAACALLTERNEEAA